MTDLTDFLLARIADDEAELESRGGWNLLPRKPFAEINAKRRIVEHCRAVTEDETEYGGWVWFAEEPMRLLALPYADHSDYREEWRP